MTSSGARRASPAVYRRRRLTALLVLLLGAAAVVGGLWILTGDSGESAEPDAADGSPAAEGGGSAPTDGETSPVVAAEQEAADADEAGTDDVGSPSPGSTTAEPAELDSQVSEPSADPDSRHVLVNRLNPLQPRDYEPEDLRDLQVEMVYAGQQMREEPADAIEELFAGAADEGHLLAVTTAYRDYGHQQALYEGRRAESGQETADKYTARPGHSEHQTGLAVDVTAIANEACTLGDCFGDTPEGIWVAENAHEFGFIIRYPEGAEEVTGYAYEPWHLRYVGAETAEAVHEEGTTLEQFWNEPPAPEYADDAEDDPAVGAG